MTFKRVLNNLQPGTYAIRVKAVGSGLLDSEWSALFTVVVTGDTTPPPTPAAPTVSQSLAGINIIWDEPSYTVPVDFAGVEVYSSVDSYTTPIGFITVKGGVQPFTTQEYSTVYRFKFKAVDRSGNKSAFSPESNAISPAKLVESDVTAGILDFEEIPYKDNGNFVSDGSFETTSRQNTLIDINTALKISFGTSGAFLGTGSLNILSGGLNQDIYLMGDPASTSFVNQYPIIVNPSDVYLGRLAVKNQSGSAATVTLKMRVYKTDLTTTDLTLVTQSVSSSSSWQTLTVNTTQANRVIPANGYAAQIFVTSTREIAIDTVEVRQVIGTALIQDAAITNAQIVDATIQSAKIANLAAGKITSDSITSAELQISSTGKLYAGSSPSTGARLLFDVNGLRAFDSSNVNTVNISSNGSASFTGSLTATTGTFTGFMTAGQIRIGSGVSGSNNGIHNVTTGDYIYDNGLVRLGNGALVYNGSTLSINANGTFSGSLSAASGTFSGSLSAVTGTFQGTMNAGSININNNFTVSTTGVMTATGATINGRLTLPSAADTIRFVSGATTLGTIDYFSGSGISIYHGSASNQGAADFTTSSAILRYAANAQITVTSNNIDFIAGTNITSSSNHRFLANATIASGARLGGQGIQGNAFSGGLSVVIRNASPYDVGVPTSSLRYKDNISEVLIDLEDINKLKTYKFQNKQELEENGSEAPWYYGMIAEYVEEDLMQKYNFANIVFYDEEGRPNSINYPDLSVLAISGVNQLHDRIQQLEERIQELENGSN